MVTHALRPDRIRARLEALAPKGINEKRASELATGGRNRDLVRKILKGAQRGTKYEWTKGLAAALECSVEYLTGRASEIGEAPGALGDFVMPSNMRGMPAPTHRSTLSRSRRSSRVLINAIRDDAAAVEVPEYDVRISAGSGALIEHAPVRRAWGFPRSFLQGLGLDPNGVALVEIVGDSMWPTLGSGDLALLDLNATNPGLSAIYVLWDGDATVVKRLEKDRKSGRIRIISDNAAYEAVEAEPDEIRVIGRVAWYARRA